MTTSIKIHRRGFTRAFALGVSLTLTACSSTHPELTSSASTILNADVNRLSSAARTGDPSAVDTAALRLQTDIIKAQEIGQLSGRRATAILAQLTRVLADTAGTVPQVAPTATPSRDTRGKEEQKGDEDHKGD